MEIERTIENVRPETSHNKILPFALTGEHHVKLHLKKSRMMPEVSEMLESINTMSGDIKKYIVEVQEHADTIDLKYISMINLLVIQLK